MAIILFLVNLAQLRVGIKGFLHPNGPKIVPADTVESVKDSTVPLLSTIQVQATVRTRLARHPRL
jgi:hypothetical protein